MTQTEIFESNETFKGFTRIKENSSFPHHVEQVGEKFKGLSSGETIEWCGTLNSIFSEHSKKNGINFIAALNSLPNKIS